MNQTTLIYSKKKERKEQKSTRNHQLSLTGEPLIRSRRT